MERQFGISDRHGAPGLGGRTVCRNAVGHAGRRLALSRTRRRRHRPAGREAPRELRQSDAGPESLRTSACVLGCPRGARAAPRQRDRRRGRRRRGRRFVEAAEAARVDGEARADESGREERLRVSRSTHRGRHARRRQQGPPRAEGIRVPRKSRVRDLLRIRRKLSRLVRPAARGRARRPAGLAPGGIIAAAGKLSTCNK
mmetsp:Transcript_15722/g.49413  ORF Transcript_15722/g.49413 Transcript_15722/m.49413 type:complete len:200 (+) Transcript_15722:1335-1934(+)